MAGCLAAAVEAVAVADPGGEAVPEGAAGAGREAAAAARRAALTASVFACPLSLYPCPLFLTSDLFLDLAFAASSCAA